MPPRQGRYRPPALGPYATPWEQPDPAIASRQNIVPVPDDFFTPGQFFTPDRFAGKTALVTGCARGMGRLAAIRLARKGANVVGVDWLADEGKSVVDGIVAEGGKAVFVAGDISETAVCDAMVKAAVDSFGGLDCAVNNAGVMDAIFPGDPIDYASQKNLAIARIDEAPDAYWDVVLRVNATGTFRSMRSELRQMLAQGRGGSYQMLHLSRFADFCGMRRIEPDQVSDATLVQFREYLDARLLGKDPDRLCAETAGTWNSVARQQPTPFTPLTAHRRTRYRSRPLTSYPQGLQDDLQAHIDRLSHKDIFEEGGPIKPLRPMTLRNIRTLVRQYLSALSEAGADPETFTSLREVVSADRIRRAAQIINARSKDGPATQTIYNILAVLLAIARHHLQLPEDEIRKIKGFKARLAPTTVGMTAKNSLRLDQFNDFQNVIRLVSMPASLMSLADDNPDQTTAPLRGCTPPRSASFWPARCGSPTCRPLILTATASPRAPGEACATPSASMPAR